MKLECERRLAGSISEQAFDRPAGRHSLRIWYLSLVWKYTTGLLSRDRHVTRNETPSRRNAHLRSLDQVSVAQPPTLHRLGKRAIWSIVSRSLTLWQARNSATYRFRFLEAVGVDETLFWRQGRWRTKRGCTSVVDVGGRQLLDIVPGRTAENAASWFRSQPAGWRDEIRWAVLDMSGPYRTAYDRVLPNASQVADPFHVIQLANQRLDEVRRRVQNETLGHRGRKNDPLRIRRLLTSASERISEGGRTRLRGLLDAGDPHREVRTAWHAKETVRAIYDIDSTVTALSYTLQLADDLQDQSCPPEINRLGRTIAHWTPQIVNWHISRVTNGPTEALNKRTAFGFRNFANYRIRALLYAGKPNWNLLATLTPH
ncbi:MAG: ISL3 family transposase [bacterium]|nr:ISL3 family transposase [bacterium]